MSRYKRNTVHKRVIKISLCVFLLFVVLVFKLFWIQIVKSDIYKKEAFKQRGKEVSICPTRGIIFDRNFIPLTNRKKQSTLYVFKEDLKKKENKDFLIENLNIDEDLLIDKINNKERLIEIPLNKTIDNNSLPKGIYIIDKTLRYDDTNLLSHVLGYIKKSENKGEYGIEKVFDDVLKNDTNGSIFFEIDGKRNYIPGGGYIVSRNEDVKSPAGIKLTVDYHIQKAVEEIMDEENKNGAVIVTDVETGDILAMSSRPNFVQDDIDLYLGKENMELYNKAIQVSYPPGSLFKVVVLLAALEEDYNIIDRNFYCNGYEQIGDLIINCNKKEGHGHLSLEEALAYSCNSVFIQLGKEVGSEKVIDMAKRLGFGEKLNIGLLEEVEGNLPEEEELIGPSIGNISIGQGNIEVTPLQISNMFMIIANNGIQKDMSIVEGIVSKDGYLIKKYNREKDKRVIAEKNCDIVKKYLEGVVEYGTGRNMNLENIRGAGGKTGSAQAVLNKRNTIHGWFAGYFPKDNPKYVVTVFVEEGNSGSMTAIPIFEKVAKEINQIRR